MEKEKPIILKSLKTQVYEYLRAQIHLRNMKAGEMININEICQTLGISKTPLRDVLVQLEVEGFVSFLPRRGFAIRPLTRDDIRQCYEVIASLESAALTSCAGKFSRSIINKMKKLNRQMQKAVNRDDFDLFYENNLAFHNTYIHLSGNRTLEGIVNTLKKKLYDFPHQEDWIKEWEEDSIIGHQQLIDFIEAGKFAEAAKFIHEVVWSFAYHSKYIEQYYFPPGDEEEEPEVSRFPFR